MILNKNTYFVKMPDQELPKALPLYFTLNSMKWMYYGQGEPGFIVKQTKTRLGGYDALADPYKKWGT